MKALRIYMLLFAGVLTFSACDVIEKEPVSALSQGTFFATKSDANSALMGVYDGMQQLVEDMLIYGELRSDNVKGTYGSRGQDIHLLYNQTITPENTWSRWSEFYSAINRANGVIKLVPPIVEKDPQLTQNESNTIVGEAMYLRALTYYYLARTWGDVPLLTEPSLSGSADFQIPKTSHQEVLDHVISDLEFILEAGYLPVTHPGGVTHTKGRATRAAAQALLASVYLWQGNYQKAADYAQMVISNSGYTLVVGTAWHSIFAENQNSAESIFELQFNLGQQETNRLYWLTNGLAGGAYLVSPSQEALEMWAEEGDQVRGAGRSFRESFYPKIFKYEMMVPDDRSNFPNIDMVPIRPALGNLSDGNFIVSRLSDVILMRAEALNRLGQKQPAIVLLNQIRARVGLPAANVMGTSEVLTSSATTEQIEDAILHERRLELAFEGHRWFDLVRMARNGRPEVLIERIIASDQYEKDHGQFGLIDKNVPGEEVIRDPMSWFMPIHRLELQENRKLEQNPFYK